MSIDFIALDFETANQRKASPCSVGMIKVIDGAIKESFYTLINPEAPFDRYNIFVHGITPDMTARSPIYPSIIPDMRDFISELPVVAHYAPFDMSVIRESNARYQVTDFQLKYFDSYYLSKAYLTMPSYKLNVLAEYVGFTFQHHHALEDAKASAAIITYLCRQHNIQSIEELLRHANYPAFGTVDGSSGNGFRKKAH